MCGIACAVGLHEEGASAAVQAMCDRMEPRGPDDSGIETVALEPVPVVLGSRRLSIIDLSDAGHQPMTDRERGTTIAYNGMLYNYRELRGELEAAGEPFFSDCDTEVLLRLLGRWGPGGLARVHGMFAFVMWDRRDRSLLIGRDRLGIKPLFVRTDGKSLLAASQVRALLASGIVEPEIDEGALAGFLAYGAVQEPETIIQRVRAFPPGSFGIFRDGMLHTERYWSSEAADGSGSDASPTSLRRLLRDAVRSHLVSDAPLGVFLSGGIDSSVLAALAARETDDLHTVSVVFEEPEYSEEAFSSELASHIGSKHLAVRFTRDDVAETLSGAFDAMDQPTFDGVNTFVVARAAAQMGLKVAVSGLGADELFDGYGFAQRAALLERGQRLPTPLRRATASLATVVAGPRRAAKAGFWAQHGRRGSSYDLMRRVFLDDEIYRLCGQKFEPSALLDETTPLRSQVARLELAGYLRNVLLRDTDAMSMGQSIEVRVPYLDDTLVEWALRVPPESLGRRKALLVAATSDLIPERIAARRKKGFALPLREWMLGPLLEDVDERLMHFSTNGGIDRTEAAHLCRDFQRSGARWLRAWALYAFARWLESVRAEARAA